MNGALPPGHLRVVNSAHMDQAALNRALAQFEGFKSNLPPSIAEDCVQEYHGIVDALSAATGEVLDEFKIGDAELAKKVKSFVPTGYSGRPGNVKYSDQRYCNTDRFKRQITGLSHYLERQGYRIAPATQARAQRAGQGIYVENMIGSAIQQGASHSPITIHFDAKSADFRALIQDKIPSLGLDRRSADHLNSDALTIEAQITSPVPKKSIIVECMSSIRTILEGAAGSALAVGVLHEIAKYFP